MTQEKNPGDITTIEDEGSVEEARHAWHQMSEQLDCQAGIGWSAGMRQVV